MFKKKYYWLSAVVVLVGLLIWFGISLYIFSGKIQRMSEGYRLARELERKVLDRFDTFADGPIATDTLLDPQDELRQVAAGFIVKMNKAGHRLGVIVWDRRLTQPRNKTKGLVLIETWYHDEVKKD